MPKLMRQYPMIQLHAKPWINDRSWLPDSSPFLNRRRTSGSIPQHSRRSSRAPPHASNGAPHGATWTAAGRSKDRRWDSSVSPCRRRGTKRRTSEACGARAASRLSDGTAPDHQGSPLHAGAWRTGGAHVQVGAPVPQCARASQGVCIMGRPAPCPTSRYHTRKLPALASGRT